MERFSGKRLNVVKGHGTENDFVLMLDPDGKLPLSEAFVRFACDRRAGVGADGVIRAVKSEAIAEGAGYPAGTWFMDYWNSDGSLSEMCGNGVRVFAAFLEDVAGVDFGPGVAIGTRAGERTVTALGSGNFAVGMGRWAVPFAADGADSMVLATGLGPRPALSVDVGNPHTVVALATLDDLHSLSLDSAPVVDPPPPGGSNVEFVVPLGERVVDGETRRTVQMRVHERGSGETRSCGTGAVAAALAVRTWAGDLASDVWDVLVPGGTLTVRIVGQEAVLEGPAALVAHAVLSVP